MTTRRFGDIVLDRQNDASGNWIEVLDGIKEGEKVVTAANFLIDSESQLKAAMGAMKH